MYYCRDNNINYYKYTSPSSSKFVQKFKNIELGQILTETLSYLLSTFLLALFLIVGYLFITKQESILSQQIEYIFSNDIMFPSKKYPTYMVKSGKNSLGKQEIARIDKILTNCNNSKIISSSLINREENVRTIIVKKGDTLYTLADKAYGNASYYSLIFDANPKILKSKRDLKTGQVLRIPF